MEAQRRTIMCGLLGVAGSALLGIRVPATATPTTVGPPPPTAERARAGDGYRDLEAAAKLLAESDRFTRATAPEAADADRDAALADPVVIQALARTRRGIGRGVNLAADEAEENLLPRYAVVRSVARLLAMQQDAQLRAGDAKGAIDTARRAMRLGRAVQEGPLIAGFVGVAIRALPVTTFGRHIERLDVRAAARLLAASREWLSEPAPFPTMLAAERRVSRRMVVAHFPNPAAVNASLGRLFDQARAQWKKPAWERGPLEIPADLEGSVAAQVAGPLERAMEVLTRERARIGLLAVHAAIRRYRLEQGTLPETLEGLQERDVIVDPFTGKPFTYIITGATYQLTSAGPRAEPGDPRAVAGRRPIGIAPGE
jgi:hypothetical protein